MAQIMKYIRFTICIRKKIVNKIEKLKIYKNVIAYIIM